MPSLREIQTGFAASVFRDEDGAIAPHVRDGVFPAAQYLQVYRNNVYESLTAALKDVYPVVTRLVGEGFMRYAAHEFIARHRPRSGNLHEFGAELAEFLAAFEPARELAYLPDVARLEWAYQLAFHAVDAEAMRPEALGAVDPNRYAELRFRLHPSARLLASPYPVLRIWHANQDEGDAGEVSLDEGGERVLVIRRGIEVEFERLTEGEFALLTVMSAGGGFDEACERALAAEPGFSIAENLQRHVVNRTIVSFVQHDRSDQ